MSQHLHSDFKIRIPDELKEKVRRSADELNRSMTADIVARLEASFAAEESPRPIGVGVNDDFLKDAGLTREQFGAFVRKSFSDSLKDDKGSE